jgi:hypothetical protein
LKGIFMTSTTFFTGSSPASGVTGNRAAPMAHKARAGAQARPSASPAMAAYPWMTQAMFGKLSARARRLLRADD